MKYACDYEPLMESLDYKERLQGDFYYTECKYLALLDTLAKHDLQVESGLKTSNNILQIQCTLLKAYLCVLLYRAKTEDVTLEVDPKVEDELYTRSYAFTSFDDEQRKPTKDTVEMLVKDMQKANKNVYETVISTWYDRGQSLYYNIMMLEK